MTARRRAAARARARRGSASSRARTSSTSCRSALRAEPAAASPTAAIARSTAGVCSTRWPTRTSARAARDAADRGAQSFERRRQRRLHGLDGAASALDGERHPAHRRRAVQHLARLRRATWCSRSSAGSQPGINPELEMLALPRRARLREHRRAARLVRTRRASRSTRRSASLQRHIAGARDGWDLALDAFSAGRGRRADRARCQSSARSPARMHTLLASDPDDPDFAPEEPHVRDDRAAGRDDRRASSSALFVELPDDASRSARSPAAARSCASTLRAARAAGLRAAG